MLSVGRQTDFIMRVHGMSQVWAVSKRKPRSRSQASKGQRQTLSLVTALHSLQSYFFLSVSG